MELSADVKGELNTRLRRIEGQIRGLQAMLNEDRDCRDIVTQLAAASKALDQVGFKLLPLVSPRSWRTRASRRKLAIRSKRWKSCS